MRRAGGARERPLSPPARPAPTPWRTRTREKSRPPWGHGGRDVRAAGEKSARTGGGRSVGACRAVPGLDPQQVQRPALVAVIERIVDAVEDLHPAAQRFGVALQRLGARLDQRLDAGIEVVQALQATAVAR